MFPTVQSETMQIACFLSNLNRGTLRHMSVGYELYMHMYMYVLYDMIFSYGSSNRQPSMAKGRKETKRQRGSESMSGSERGMVDEL